MDAESQQGPAGTTNYLDTERKTLKIGGREVALTFTEYRLLEVLTLSPGRVFTPGELLTRLDAAGDHDAFDSAIASHISRLRLKLEQNPREPRHLTTLRGLGYRFEW